MDKKFVIAWVVLFVVWMAGSFLVHGLWLGETYKSMTALYRPEADQQATFPFMLLAHVMLAGGFIWIYRRGREHKPWLGQGIRFGIIIALFAAIPTYLIYYAVQPLGAGLVVRQIVGDTLLLLVLGALVAFLYKDASNA
ncbi:MAG: hypothetical protein R3288_08630 [Woeseiaceae bacterium]|nr:hypothetical protein [Woeseiaceae bacterium]